MGRYDIAVIGMGCVLPGANNVKQYWENIKKGDSYFKKMSNDLWHMDNFYAESRSVPEKTYTTTGSFIEGFKFPFLEYRLPPKVLQGVDPAQLVTLEAAREALSDAGIEPRSEQLANAITIIGSSGVDQFAHATTVLKRHTYFKKLRPLLKERGVSQETLDKLDSEFLEELTSRGHAWNPAVAAVGAITASVSNRVAQVFGVKGYNMTVDAACASSFVALDTACQALMAGDTRLAIAGGSDLGTNPAIYVGFSRVEGLSITGNSNPFDHTADGLVIGEGVGVVVLKKLEDALSDGDNIRAVIRGIGTSSDGWGQAIYAPSVDGRAEALRNALEKSVTDAAEVQYIEAHATSTIVGDANEYDAVSKVYAPNRNANDPLRLGSVKHQIGHLKAAAGMAGLLKTILAMENGLLPHMPRFTKLTPGAEYPSDRLLVPTKIEPWQPRNNGMRVAAVTSSGFGGVNYHCILEQGESYTPPPQRETVPRDMAIVQVTCRVAQADNPEAFWENLKSGKDVFTRETPESIGWTNHLDRGPEKERITTRVLSRIEPYDLNLLRHKIFPNAVSQVAPTQFLGLDLADRLLQQAGQDLRTPKKVGVSIGAMHDDYFPDVFLPLLPEEYADSIRHCPVAGKIDSKILDECLKRAGEQIRAESPPVTEHTLPGWMSNVIAGRIANKLNLHGPNFTVDTACSSGIAALLPAIYQLMFGNVDMMITGGLNQQLSEEFTCGVCALGAVAEEVARPFDAKGKGFLIGEGGVFFLLKRLADAERDNDDIIAVIHSIGGSSEADSKSMVAPSEEAVRRAIRNAFANSDRKIDPRSVGVVDTHGSANLLSDLVEARSLAAELRPEVTEHPVQITAVKSHIGHLYGGSGAASLFSAIQSIRDGVVPGIRNLENPRPEIEEISDRVRPRFGTEQLRFSTNVGAANSLGLGGANYFALFSTPNSKTASQGDTGDPQTGRTRPQENAMATQKHIVRADDESANDIFVCVAEGQDGIGSALGRALQQIPIPHFISEGNTPSRKLAVTFSNQGELKNKLGSALKMIQGGHDLKPLESQGIFVASIEEGAEPEKLVFCFPGQGTHYITMGRHLYEENASFKNVLDTIDRLARTQFDFGLLDHIYGNPEDPEISKNLGTLVGAQTALFAVEVGMARVMGELGAIPSAMVGHSFGEISALTAAGVWDLETAYKVVEARIRTAETVISGGGPKLGMMSLICSDEQRDAILRLVEGKVVLSNVNAPGRFVLAGKLDAVKQTVAVAESFGVDARLLPIGAAFHTHFMEPARELFKSSLLKLPCEKPKYPILSTVTGEYIDPDQVSTESLAVHLSTQFVTKLDLPREIGRLHREGYRHYLEVGPGWSMTKMIGAILANKEHLCVPTLHPKVGDIETFRRARAFLMAHGHLVSAAERKNLPGIFSTDFVQYLETSEPAVLALIEEVHRRYVDKTRENAAREMAPDSIPAPAPSVRQSAVATQSASVEVKREVESVKVKPTHKAVDPGIWVERVREKLVAITGYPAEMLEENLDLEADLGVDSVQRAEIWMALTKEHGLDSEARPSSVRTISQLAESLAALSADEVLETAAKAGEQTGLPDPGSTEKEVSAAVPAKAEDLSVWVERVREKLVAITGYPAEMLEENLDLEADLGVDSVQRAEIWMALTKEHGLDSEARPTSVRTISQLAESLAILASPVTSEKVEPAATPTALPEKPKDSRVLEKGSAPASEAEAGDVATWVERVRERLVEVTGYPAEMLEENLDLEADLGVDSVQRAEIWLALSKQHGLDTEERPKGIRTIAQLAEALAMREQPSEKPLSGNSEGGEGEKSSEEEGGDESCNLFVTNTIPLGKDELEPFSCENVLCVVTKRDKWAHGLATRLELDDKVVVELLEVKELLDLSEARLIEQLAPCDTIVYAAHKEMASSQVDVSVLRKRLKKELSKLYDVFRTLAKPLGKNAKRIIVPVARDGFFGARPKGPVKLFGTFPAGFVRCMARELPDCHWQIIDAGKGDWGQALADNLMHSTPNIDLGVGELGVVQSTLSRVAPAQDYRAPLEKGDWVIVIGGARGIVFECVLALAKETGCNLLLTGRTEVMKQDADWLHADPASIDTKIREMEINLVRNEGKALGEAKKIGRQAKFAWELGRNLERLRAEGIEAAYRQCDVTDALAFSALLKEVAKTTPIKGIVHGAGVQRSKLIGELEQSVVQTTVETKISPLLTLLDVADWKQVRLLVGFGSITGLFGNAGQTDYALANDLLGWMIAEIGRIHPHIQAQTIDWTAWTGTGMVTDEEAKRFEQAGLRPLHIEEGVRLFLDGICGSSHAQLAAFNGQAAFAARRPLCEFSVAARPRKSLLNGSKNSAKPRARFSPSKDVFLGQHLVEMAPVVPGTFVSEIFLESIANEPGELKEIQFRRPLWVREENFAVDVVNLEGKLLLLPASRPDLGEQGLGNLSFATCQVAKPEKRVDSELVFTKSDYKKLISSVGSSGPSFYSLLDEKFSQALKTGPIFRGIQSTLERDGLYLGLVQYTEDAARAVELKGDFVFNPVLADMAVQVACSWAMQKHSVMAIPKEIGRLQIYGSSEKTEAVVVCKAVDLNDEKPVIDVVVREPDGRPIFAMNRLVLSTIARA